MAKRLTDEMVIARTKISDLSKIKRLNCWGSELQDVSLLRKMPSVEVLSLSINKINTLVDFQLCKQLEELYIRQNEIKDINQVVYLQHLPNLKNLWLGENPCASVEGYRLSVIKALPQILKLDNVQITTEEAKEAQRKGKPLTHPEDVRDSDDEEVGYTSPQQFTRYQDYSGSEYSPVQRSPPHQETEYEMYESGDCYQRDEASEGSREYSPPRPASPPRPLLRSYTPEQVVSTVRKNSFDRESPKQQYYDKSPPAANSFEEQSPCTDNSYREAPHKLVTSQSASCIKEYSNGDRYVPPNYRQIDNIVDAQPSQGQERRYVCSASSHRPPFNRRPITRNSNILSAVLCLVKELDYPSLEVVEMAVRCRMDELDD